MKNKEPTESQNPKPPQLPKATVHLDHGTGKREVFTLPIAFETTSGFALIVGDNMIQNQSNLNTEWFPKHSLKCSTVRVG